MKICIHVAQDCLEGSMSQHFDILPSFYFMLRISWNLGGKITKNNKSFPFMSYNQNQGINKKNLRHASLDKNVSYACLKVGTCRSNIKGDIHVEKNKSGKIT